MPEFTFKVEPYGVDYRCDKCGQGVMSYNDGNIKLECPPKYTHKCNGCSHEQDFIERYPAIRYRLIP
ncbi:hypothetical protein P9274_20105 [Schinkia azotoformans]|uniref:hypothetical protein n=1 Tax=Schinkia azotoformans TaxID=1454 RepID=UPI002E214E02|nr:hypothetical protein [Schinkia azotoformans]